MEQQLVIKIKKMHPNAVVPTYSHGTEDACFDLTACDVSIDKHGNSVFNLGWAFEIPEGYVGLIFPRSSQSNMDMIMSNLVGIIDPGYRGPVTAKFRPQSKLPASEHTSNEYYHIGDRVCQMLVIKNPHVQLKVVDELSDTNRGTGKYGSTGR